MNAMWLTDLEVAGMSEDQFRNELLYQTTMSIAKNLLKQEVISKKEYKLIDTIFTKKYNPSLGSLLADINLISI
jgi:transcriptional regulator CtsR